MRLVLFLASAVVFAVGSANAQSSADSTLLASNSSSAPAWSSSALSLDGMTSAVNGAANEAANEAANGAPTASPISPSGAASAQENGERSRHTAPQRSLFTFELGAGFNAPVANDIPYISWGGNLTVGGGVNLTRHLALMAEYQFIDNKLPGNLIAQVGADSGNAYFNSITLSPVLDLFPRRTNSVYLTGGGGFYHKLTTFSSPVPVFYCDYFGDCGVGYASSTVYQFSSNQAGGNAGIGFTHRLRGNYRNSRARLYAEVRYLFVNTPPISQINGLGTTELIPVTFGVRW